MSSYLPDNIIVVIVVFMLDVIYHRHHFLFLRVLSFPPQWGTLDAEIKDPSVEDPDLKGFPSMPGVGQNVTMNVSDTSRDFFLELISTLPPGSFICICPETSPEFFMC